MPGFSVDGHIYIYVQQFDYCESTAFRNVRL